MSVKRSKGEFTGWHAAAMLAGFFGVIVVVNLIMASYAVSTFGGVVVENSYVASQHFNRWLDEARRSKELGWEPAVSRLPDGTLAVVLTGAPADVRLEGTAHHPLGSLPDTALTFVPDGAGGFRTAAPLPAGRWIIRLAGRSGADVWRAEETLE